MIKPNYKITVVEPNNFNIDSGVIANKKVDGVILMYDMSTNDNDIDVENELKEELLEKLSSCLNHDPDGVLVWIPKNLQDKFVEFVSQYIQQECQKNILNFDNGSVCEAFGFHYLEQGMLVEMIDPECDSEIFNEVLRQFYQNEHVSEDSGEKLDLNQVFSYQGYHLFSDLKTRNEENSKFYDVIKMIKKL